MKCPNCGLINPNSAQQCDCGYDFLKAELKSSNLIQNEKSKYFNLFGIYGLIIGICVAGFNTYLIFDNDLHSSIGIAIYIGLAGIIICFFGIIRDKKKIFSMVGLVLNFLPIFFLLMLMYKYIVICKQTSRFEYRNVHSNHWLHRTQKSAACFSSFGGILKYNL